MDHYEQPSVKFESKYKISIDENAFEVVVCKKSGRFVQGEMISMG